MRSTGTLDLDRGLCQGAILCGIESLKLNPYRFKKKRYAALDIKEQNNKRKNVHGFTVPQLCIMFV